MDHARSTADLLNSEQEIDHKEKGAIGKEGCLRLGEALALCPERQMEKQEEGAYAMLWKSLEWLCGPIT